MEQAEQAPKILNNLSKERGDGIGLYCGKGLGLGDLNFHAGAEERRSWAVLSSCQMWHRRGRWNCET